MDAFGFIFFPYRHDLHLFVHNVMSAKNATMDKMPRDVNFQKAEEVRDKGRGRVISSGTGVEMLGSHLHSTDRQDQVPDLLENISSIKIVALMSGIITVETKQERIIKIKQDPIYPYLMPYESHFPPD